MAITEKGFKRRTYDEILQADIARAKSLFGEDIQTSETTAFGKFIRLGAYDLALAEEEIEMVYYAIFPHTAIGTSLDRLCVFVGISRNPATCAQYTVTVNGTAGATVPQGFLVGTDSGINYANKADTVIGEDGTAEITVECVESGEIGNVVVSEIKKIVNPTSDTESIVCTNIVAKGQETESDYELRNRFNEAKEGLGSCNEVAIKAALLRVPTVTHAGVITDETNGSFESFVSGGENYHKEIAEAIFDKKPIGIKTTGNVTQEIVDISGATRIIKFSHTTNINIYVRVAITTSAAFEGDKGKQAIKDNLETHIDNTGIGKPVIISSLYGKIHSVTGVTDVTEILLSVDGQSWYSANTPAEVGEYENCLCYQVEINQNGGGYEVIE